MYVRLPPPPQSSSPACARDKPFSRMVWCGVNSSESRETLYGAWWCSIAPAGGGGEGPPPALSLIVLIALLIVASE